MNEQFQSNSTNISEIETHFFFEKEAFSMKMAVNDLLKKSASPRCCSQGCLAPAPALAPLLARSRRSRRLPQEACLLCRLQCSLRPILISLRPISRQHDFNIFFPSNVHTVPSLDQKETRGISICFTEDASEQNSVNGQG